MNLLKQIKKFKDMRVEFKAIDFTNNKIPKADICMLRFVLQHLSNESILNFLKLSADNFKYIILTEHLPDNEKFVANLDMPTSSYIRLAKNSGIVLTKPPFNLKVVNEKLLCNLKPKNNKDFEGVCNTKILQIF